MCYENILSYELYLDLSYKLEKYQQDFKCLN